jgi:Ca-activated chloride channel homolog
MEWQWPGSLWLLGLLPLAVAAYVWVLRRRRKYAVRYASLALVRAAAPTHWSRRRHVPFGLWLLALGSLVGAMGRPVAAVPVPSARATVMLVMDVSLSMCSTDIEPSRLQAAQTAALGFIRDQAPGTQIGLVAFASFAVLVQPPTTDQNQLQAAVRHLDTGLGTAIGSGIAAALKAIDDQRPPATQTAPRMPGEYAPEIIVLLTDGVATVGDPPLEAAQQAADRGVRVFPIGFGTPTGAYARCEGDAPPAGGAERQLGWDPQQGFSGYHEGVDEPTLRQIAQMTGGNYYAATSAGELRTVLADLPAMSVTQIERIEVTVVLAGLGALLALSAMLLSMRWNGVM